MFSAVVQQLLSIPTADCSIAVAYYYCRFQNDTHDDLSLILRRWLAQISDKLEISQGLKELHDACHEHYPPRDPTSSELEKALLECLAERTRRSSSVDTKRTYLLIDALDELSLEDGQSDEILDMVRRIASMNLGGVSILATSREHAIVAEYLASDFTRISADYQAIDQEIAAHIPRMIATSFRLRRQPNEVKDAITERLVSEANGIYVIPCGYKVFD